MFTENIIMEVDIVAAKREAGIVAVTQELERIKHEIDALIYKLHNLSTYGH